MNGLLWLNKKSRKRRKDTEKEKKLGKRRDASKEKRNGSGNLIVCQKGKFECHRPKEKEQNWVKREGGWNTARREKDGTQKILA